MIFGRPGSGKSTFAYKLHLLTGIPVYHLDKYFFKDNWQKRDPEHFLSIQHSLVNEPSWIIDGMSYSLEMRYQKADLVLYFNYPRITCYYRVFKRLFNKNPLIDDRAPNCKEKVKFDFLKYMWNFEKRIEKQVNPLRAQYPSTRFEEIRNDSHLKIIENELMEDI
ncbi:DNA topology modulation protein [Rickettsiales endosymbiont of Stachyamoeba lipophora]|nr:DNA topology modulation protein [Rickettsiales endosymbiont of Stachyamoeba lipophora]